MQPEERPDDKLLIRYLLGDHVPEEEVARIEERYFTDDRCFDRLMELEDELIDTYVRGGLAARERKLFQERFLSSARRRKKWEDQQAIADFFRAAVPPAPFWHAFRRFVLSQPVLTRFALTAVALVFLASLAYFGVGAFRLQGTVAGLQARLAKAQSGPARAVAVFVLAPGVLRSNAGEMIRIQPGTGFVNLQLRLQPAAGAFSYTAVLSTAEGEELWRQSRLTGSGAGVEVTLPAKVLAPGDYVLSLTAFGQKHERWELSSYVFRVQR